MEPLGEDSHSRSWNYMGLGNAGLIVAGKIVRVSTDLWNVC